MSQRRSSSADDDRILDAARDTVMAVGARRATVTDVARRAGLSRMTVYRRFPDAAGLLQALMTREFTAVVAESAAAARDAGDARERIVAMVRSGSALLSGHPLLRRLLDVDPELLLPYVTTRVGHFQLIVLDALVEQLRAGQADGSVRAGDAGRMAEAIELALRGWVLMADADVPAAVREAQLGELVGMVEAALRP